MEQTKGVRMKRLFFLFFIVLIACMAAGCSKSGSAGKSGKLTVIYTGNIGGILESCGCRIPKGGIAKRATVLAEMKQEAPDAIVLDSGALLHDSSRLNPPLEDVYRRRMRLLVDEFKRMGIDGANISHMDLSNTADSLVAYGSNGLPWLSANVAWKNSGKLIFQADTLRTVGDLTVGIFGFMDDNTMGVAFFDESSPIKVLNPTETVRAEVQKLRKKCDVLICLAYMDMDRVQKLVTDIPGIDVAVVSHTRSHNPSSEHPNFQPVKQGKTLLVRCPDGGRVVGRLELSLVNGSPDFTDAEANKDLRPEEVQRADKRAPTVSTYRNFFTDLDPDVKRVPEIQAKVDAVMKYWSTVLDAEKLKK